MRTRLWHQTDGGAAGGNGDRRRGQCAFGRRCFGVQSYSSALVSQVVDDAGRGRPACCVPKPHFPMGLSQGLGGQLKPDLRRLQTCFRVEHSLAPTASSAHKRHSLWGPPRGWISSPTTRAVSAWLVHRVARGAAHCKPFRDPAEVAGCCSCRAAQTCGGSRAARGEPAARAGTCPCRRCRCRPPALAREVSARRARMLPARALNVIFPRSSLQERSGR